MAVPTRTELDARIRENIASDPGFRKALIDNPRTAVSSLLGVTLPEMVNIEVHEESLAHIHLVLPASTSTSELSESDLEMVAGGDTCWADSTGSIP